MASTNIDLVQQYYNSVVEALKNLNEAKKRVSDKQAEVNELQRQIDYHTNRGDTVNANVVRGRIVTPKGELSVLLTQLSSYQKVYDDAEALYQQKNRELLTAEQQTLLNEKIRIEAERASANNLVDQAKEESKKLVQGTTKYLIIGGIVLAVIILGVIVLRKKLSP